ncbi:nuclear receptor corepressor 2-like, partial [Ostrinia furnacalis]|uniref:nuclear receptor corepressor 2-like n=1 Tax=Ostrinia furnacalis TaxID=93504 RepID=UPI00103F1A42
DGSYVRGGGAVGEYRGGTRMSMLGSGYLPAPAPQPHHPPPADPPPFKKIRFGVERPPPTPLPVHQPLRVDTRVPVNAYNAVELSPNPPSEPTAEDSFRTTKDDLLQQISKVDREMALSEATLAKLKKKQEELEQTASKPARAEEPEEAVPRHRSLAQCVYADNRKKAASAHALLSHLGPQTLYPVYNQPQDTPVYHENIRRHRTFRKRLAAHIHRLRREAEKVIVAALHSTGDDGRRLALVLR